MISLSVSIDQLGLPRFKVLKNPPADAGDIRDVSLISGLGRSPEVGNGNLTPVFLPAKFHGQRSLMGYSPWSRRESDMTE